MNKKILAIDDEPYILNALKRVLEDEFEIITTTSGEEGLTLLEQSEFSVVISDQRMPEITGTELFKIIKSKHPDTMRIILSGYAEIATIMESINEGAIYKFIVKPWEDDFLTETIKEACEHYNIKNENKLLQEELASAIQELEKINTTLEHIVKENEKKTEKINTEKSLLESIIQTLPYNIYYYDHDGRIQWSKSQNAEQDTWLIGKPITDIPADIDTIMKKDPGRILKEKTNNGILESTHYNILSESISGGIIITRQINGTNNEQHIVNH